MILSILLGQSLSNKSIVLKVVNFREALLRGSKGFSCSICKTNGIFLSGKIIFTLGGLELNTPFRSLIIKGCCLTKNLSTGCKTDDSIER